MGNSKKWKGQKGGTAPKGGEEVVLRVNTKWSGGWGQRKKKGHATNEMENNIRVDEGGQTNRIGCW